MSLDGCAEVNLRVGAQVVDRLCDWIKCPMRFARRQHVISAVDERQRIFAIAIGDRTGLAGSRSSNSDATQRKPAGSNNTRDHVRVIRSEIGGLIASRRDQHLTRRLENKSGLRGRDYVATAR